MKKILFITSRNILETSGELRLIKNRAYFLEKDFGIESDYIVYRFRKLKYEKSEKINSDMSVYCNPKEKYPLKKCIKDKLSTYPYLCVIISGSFVLQFIPYIRKIDPSIRIVLDIHGAIDELREYRSTDWRKQFVRNCVYWHALYDEKKYFPQADGALIVSRALGDFIENEIKTKIQKTFIVPCSVGQELNYEDYIKFRYVYREKYELKEDDIVFIYSGGNSPWQCVEQSVQLYKKIKEKNPDKEYRMLLFSGSKELVAQYENDPEIIVDSLAPFEIVKALCAGDYGILLRENYITNNVAFPNKFLEYILSGLRVIATPYVYEIAEYIKQYDMGVVIDKLDDADTVDYYIHNNESYSDFFLRREKLLKICTFQKTLKPFAEYIQG